MNNKETFIMVRSDYNQELIVKLNTITALSYEKDKINESWNVLINGFHNLSRRLAFRRRENAVNTYLKIANWLDSTDINMHWVDDPTVNEPPPPEEPEEKLTGKKTIY